MPADAILNHVCRALEALIASAQPYDGLFPSVLDRATGSMPAEMPPLIPGQRAGDRVYQGCNLMHDEATLLTLYALDRALGRPDFSAAADAYLQRFATHCTDTATGLFPWGEHAYWDLAGDCIGNSYRRANPGYECAAIHDHLRQAPVWLWEKLAQFNPRCVERFAEGLDYHWVACEPREYIRHAPIDVQMRQQQESPHSCDFPRHSGFYLLGLGLRLAAEQAGGHPPSDAHHARLLVGQARYAQPVAHPESHAGELCEVLSDQCPPDKRSRWRPVCWRLPTCSMTVRRIWRRPCACAPHSISTGFFAAPHDL